MSQLSGFRFTSPWGFGSHPRPGTSLQSIMIKRLQKHAGWPVPVLPWMILLAVWRQQTGSCSTWLESIPSSPLHLKLFWMWMKPRLLTRWTSSVIFSDDCCRWDTFCVGFTFLWKLDYYLSGVVVLSWRFHVSFICCGCLITIMRILPCRSLSLSCVTGFHVGSRI